MASLLGSHSMFYPGDEFLHIVPYNGILHKKKSNSNFFVGISVWIIFHSSSTEICAIFLASILKYQVC